MHPIVASHIINKKMQYQPLRSLEQIISDHDKLEKIARTRISFEAVIPQIDKNLASYVKI